MRKGYEPKTPWLKRHQKGSQIVIVSCLLSSFVIRYEMKAPTVV